MNIVGYITRTRTVDCESVVRTTTHAQSRNGLIDSDQILHIDSLCRRSDTLETVRYSKFQIVSWAEGGGVRNLASDIDLAPLTLALASVYCATAHMHYENEMSSVSIFDSRVRRALPAISPPHVRQTLKL